MERKPRRRTWVAAAGLVATLLLAYSNGGLEGVLAQAGPALESLQTESRPAASDADADALQRLVDARISGEMLSGSGRVRSLLRDDLEGSRHQRFILELRGGQTLLVSHNIDLAPRVDALQRGDTVEFYGQYEWNEKGGVLHWTHRDPAGRHADGWLRHAGITYR